MARQPKNDFRVYEETDRNGEAIWRIRSGGRRGDVATNCRTPEAAAAVAEKLNMDPWYLSRGDTRADRNA